jgi:hypothetical protein
VKNTGLCSKITVSADGNGLVSQAGGLLLAEALRVTGLGRGLSGALARWRAPRAGARSGEDDCRPGHGAGAGRGLPG